MSQKKHQAFAQNADEKRMDDLELCIDVLFGSLDLDELELLEQSYSISTTTMIEIAEIRARSSVVNDLHDDTEFKPVDFPQELLFLLRREDVFLVTMGFNEGRWKILHMSPPYYQSEG